jgi:hypothetical protein
MKEGKYIVFLKEGGVVKTVKKIVDPTHNGKMSAIFKATGFEYSTDKHKKMHKATTH